MKHDQIRSLLAIGDPAIALFTKRDLLGESVSTTDLWGLREAERILRRQNENGAWLYQDRNAGARTHRTQLQYDQYETFLQLGILVEQYGFDRSHSAIQRAAKFLFSFQSDDGDIRGIYGNQFSPNYTAGITELLIKAGYVNDPHVKKVFSWLLANRQADGGWALPFRTRGYGLDALSRRRPTLQPQVAKPSSHMVTGVVLRAFAAHPRYRKRKEAGQAAALLLASLFKRDRYADRAAAEFWFRFSFPFCYTDLISAMDSLSLLQVPREEPQARRALEWFGANQQEDGLWKIKVVRGRNRDLLQAWLALAICRIFKRYSDLS